MTQIRPSSRANCRQWATRLLILRGNFEKLTLAVYGVTVPEVAPTASTYEPSLLPTIQTTELIDALNPALHHDPTATALSLLRLIPDAPPFSLVVCLSWCLKPDDDDWDLPDFPYIYADLEEEGEFDAEEASIITKRPIPDDVSFDVLESFVTRVVDSLGPIVSINLIS